MLSLSTLLLFIATGTVAGTLAGLLGLGGGVLYVPVLVWYLEGQATPPELIPFLAVTTSLAVIVSTLPNAAYGHWKQGHLRPRLLPPLLVGGGVAAWTASLWLTGLEAADFKLYLGLFQLFVAWRVWAGKLQPPLAEGAHPSWPVLAAIGAVAGGVSAFFGVGGGLILVPLLHLLAGVPIVQAVGTAPLYMVATTALALASYLSQGSAMEKLPPQTFLGIYLPAFLAIVPSAFLCNRLGARLAGRAPVKLLKRAISLLLLGVGGVGVARALL